MANLKSSGNTTAWEMLNERIIGCEACEMLVTKSIRAMEAEKVLYILKSCRDAWPSFSFEIKAKLAENKAFHLLPPLAEKLAEGSHAGMLQAMECLLQSVDLAMDPSTDIAISTWQATAPTFKDLVKDWLCQCARHLGLLPGEQSAQPAALKDVVQDPTSGAFQLDFDDAVKAAGPEPEKQQLDDDLQRLQASAKAVWEFA